MHRRFAMVPRRFSQVWLLAAGLLTVPFQTPLLAGDMEQKIRAELAKRTSIEFNETRLQDAMKYLSDMHSINIEIDKKKLEEANLTLDAPVSQALRGVSLASALDLILAPMGLTYIIEHEVLFITSFAGAQRSSMP